MAFGQLNPTKNTVPDGVKTRRIFDNFSFPRTLYGRVYDSTVLTGQEAVENCFLPLIV